ncbi:hypothetical protein G7046_g2415 [Stylonectria norvegica]|nr:hypothetical protein G7046_g2415 [Stylonectria norvegica]
MAHLTNPLATTSQLYHRLSFSSLPQDLQEIIFIKSQCLIQAAGRLLDLPQSVTAQANVILARYWLVDSPMANEFSDSSAAALYLVAKMGAQPRTTRDVSNVYAYLLSDASSFSRTGEAPTDDPKSYYQSESDYFSFQTRLLTIEARILYTQSFDTHVSLPHPLAITYLQILDFLAQPMSVISLRTFQYLNTALLSPQMLYLTHQPHALATAAIYNAARDLGAKMPECEWWEVFDVDREELGFLVVGMRSVEGWLRQRTEDMPQLAEGMFTRKAVQKELRARGLSDGNGAAASDEEDQLMNMLDSSKPRHTEWLDWTHRGAAMQCEAAEHEAIFLGATERQARGKHNHDDYLHCGVDLAWPKGTWRGVTSNSKCSYLRWLASKGVDKKKERKTKSENDNKSRAANEAVCRCAAVPSRISSQTELVTESATLTLIIDAAQAPEGEVEKQNQRLCYPTEIQFTNFDKPPRLPADSHSSLATASRGGQDGNTKTPKGSENSGAVGAFRK